MTPRTAALVLIALIAATPRLATAQVLVDAPPSLAPAAQRIREMDLQPLAAALARAGLELPDRIDISLIPEGDLRATATPAWIVGLASGGEAIVIFPERVGEYPYDSLEGVVRHEIAHLALNGRADNRPLPRWFHEGVAVSIESGWGLGGQVRLLLAAVRGPALRDVTRLFGADAQPEIAQAYLLATALVSDLQQRQGAQVSGAIARRVGSGMPFDQAFEREVGLSPDAAAARAWAAYLRWPTFIPALTGPSAVWAFILVLAFVGYAVRLRRRSLRRARWDEEEA